MPSRNLFSVKAATVVFSLLLSTTPSVAFQFRRSRAHHFHSILQVPESRHFSPEQEWKKNHRRIVGTALSATTKDDNEDGGNTKKKNKAKGVYVRPSGAIERGSGFFFPGLEGPRVRVLFGTVVLGLTALNHALAVSAASSSDGLSLEEIVAIGYSFLVLFQAAIEFGKEELIVEGNTSAEVAAGAAGKSGSSLLQRDLAQQWSTAMDQTYYSKDKIQWAAASYLSITPATQMLLLTKNDAILYRLGTSGSSSFAAAAAIDATTTTTIAEGVTAALDQLRQSKGGRLALPNTHPTVTALGLKEARTVVLQRITEDSCWVMSSSDQLLASFTPADLKWLGHLASMCRQAIGGLE
jgi:hypothetical protein